MRHTLLYLIILTSLPWHIANAQQSDIQQKLVDRYGQAFAWGQGYWVRANGWYAFAGKDGHLLLPFRYRKIDTVLKDRTLACLDPAGYALDIVDATGHDLTEGRAGRFRLVNKDRRLFAGLTGTDREVLFNDSGRQVTFREYDTRTPPTTLIEATPDPQTDVHGVVTLTGDTLLPLQRGAVSIGTALYAITRNDSVYVYKRGKGLLFGKAGIHACKILQNDMITIRKYGAWALASNAGKLLTPFKYYKLEDQRYPYSTIAESPYGSKPEPAAVPGIARINGAQSVGLLDAAGQEVLHVIYDNIEVNANGWKTLQKAGHDKMILVDNKGATVMEGDAYSIAFINRRYVQTTEDRDAEEAITRVYDMVQRKFVQATPHPDTVIARTLSPALPPYADNEDPVKYYTADSTVINAGGTALVRRGGLWGVCSATGDILLPFIYDTAGLCNYHLFFVGKNGKYGLLNSEGTLGTPVELPGMPVTISPDSGVVLQGWKDVYSIKGWKVRKVDVSKEPIPASFLIMDRSGMTYTDGRNSAIPAGVYNRKRQLLAYRCADGISDGPFRYSGIAAVMDSTGTRYAVIDSNGKLLIPYIKRPARLLLYNNCALAISDSATADVLYRFVAGNTVKDTVYIDPAQKLLLLKTVGNIGSYSDPYEKRSEPIRFTERGQGPGYIFNYPGTAVIVNGATEMRMGGYGMQVKTGDKWGLWNTSGMQTIPAIYDSIAPLQDNCWLIYNNGRTGLYNTASKMTIAPIYTSIWYAGAPDDPFLIAYTGDEAAFLDLKGKVISAGWTGVARMSYVAISGIPAGKYGRKGRIEVTDADTLRLVPDTDLPPGTTSHYYNQDGTVQVTVAGKKGIYNYAEKHWMICPIYSDIKEEGDYRVAYADTPAVTTTLYSPEGKKMFTLKDRRELQRIYKFDQWFTDGGNSTPVVNDAGKVIVPDSFKYVSTIEPAGIRLYVAEAADDKNAIIDAKGKMMTPAILDHVDGDNVMYGSYFTGMLDDKYCLINSAGRMLTKCIYSSISAAHKDKMAGQRGWATLTVTYIITGPGQNREKYPATCFIVSLSDTGRSGVLDSNGRTMIPCIYDSIAQVYDNIVVAKKNGHWGLISVKNKAITPFRYDHIGLFWEGSAAFSKGAVKGSLFTDGKEDLNPDNIPQDPEPYYDRSVY